MNSNLPVLYSLLLIFSSGAALADVKLPPLVSDHMVLEKSDNAAIWGKADPGEEIAVTLDGKTTTSKTGEDGKWRVKLNLKDSSPGPFEMKVKGKNEIRVADVVVGQVWVAAGQSNMQFCLRDALGAGDEIAQSANPMLRHFKVALVASLEPRDECDGKWVVAGPGTSGDFTAVGYYFGRMLQKELGVPVGIINATWGGTQAEAWTSSESLGSVPELKMSMESQQLAAKEYPSKKEAYVSQFGEWLKNTNREDKPPGDVAAYAGETAGTKNWIPVKLPGVVSGEGLPGNGAVWLRKEVNIGAKDANHELSLNLGYIDGFETIYWNGQQAGQMTYKDYPGTPYPRRYDIPANLVKEGRNVIAIRVFAPVTIVKFPGKVLKAGAYPIAGEWLAKAEFELPHLDPKAVAGVPQPPAAPRLVQGVASALFNGMVNPILPSAINGVVWYQGESNASRAQQYRTTFPLLINDWRSHWKQPEMPFYYCQLANYMPKKPQPDESRWAELREAQSMALKLPDTGQAVLIDIGESDAIHPMNKKDAGERLARIALARTYHKNIPWSGPVFDSMKIDNGKVRLKFIHADGGLVAKPLPPTYNAYLESNKTEPLVRNSPGSELEGFSICGEDHQWVWADARIDGDSVVVWSDKVAQPAAVRHAWADNPTVNLYNGAGLPASPFRTDDFPGISNLKY